MRVDVNGSRHDLAGNLSRPLLTVLRDEIGLRGTKPSCGEGVCGACTVLLDGLPVRSCVTPVADVDGRPITTIEGLASEGSLHRVQRAFLAERAYQCGYCTPGIELAAAALLQRTPDATDGQVRAALDGHICRCGVHVRVLRAVRRVRADDPGPGAAVPDPGSMPVDEPLLVADAPWDLEAPDERGYFTALGDGLVAVLPPPEPQSPWAGAWTTSGGVWLHVGAHGSVTAFTGKVEMGQDNTTALALIVARALGVDVEAVRMVIADTDVCPFDEGTFGSRSVRDAGAMLEAAGWAALEAIVRLAAERLEVSPADLLAGHGRLRTRDGAREIGYDDLLAGRQQVETVRGRPKRPHVLGSNGAGRGSKGRISQRDVAIVTGRRPFATDVTLPDMLVGAELRPPAPGARLRSIDVSAARAIPGVTVVDEDGFVGVAGPDAAAVNEAIEAIRAAWTSSHGPSDATLVAHLRAHPREAEGWGAAVEHVAGDVASGLAAADVRIDATYTAAYVAHMPLETRAAVAEWRDGRVTVWTGSQVPFEARAELADALGLAEDRVRVIVPQVGGGFGGKHGAGPGAAAARLARATARPVRVRWRHADEVSWGHVRPAAVIDVRIAAARDGTMSALDHLNVNSGASALRAPYRIANQRLRYQPADSPLPQASYRALAATANTFARESAIDELAHALDLDPLDFRLANVDDERLAAALRAAAERIGWPAGRDAGGRSGLGIAGSIEKDARVATAAEVAVAPSGEVHVRRLVTAFDCGAIVDADNLTSQIEGATMMALGPALFEAIELDDGRIANPTFASYRVPRFSDVPVIEVVLIDRPEIASAGGGEVPLIAVAPAIANAIFAASGRRLRSMPLVPDGRV